MSASTANTRTSTWVGIAVGIVLLGLMAAFAIGLPKAHGESDGTAKTAPAIDITMPDSLPGGYAAADLPDSFADGQLADQAEQIAQQQAASTQYGNLVLPEVLGNPAATRSYVVDGTKAVFVQVFQAGGGAFAPTTLTDPTTTNGSGGTTMDSVGDGVCILTYGQTQDGTPGDPVASQCQVTHGELTAQIQSTTIPAEDLVTVADGLLDDLNGGSQDQ